MFFDLADRFLKSRDPAHAEQLREELAQMIFSC